MKLTPEKLTAFCAALSETGQVKKACAAVDISMYTAYEWRKKIPDFAAAWADAMRVAVLGLESEAIRRAVEGVDEPIVHQGQFSHLYDYNAIDPETGEKYAPNFAPVLRDANGNPQYATVKKYSDTMLIFTLKAHDPKYRDSSKVTVAGDPDAPLVIDDASAASKLATLLAAAEARKRTTRDDQPEDDYDDLV
jgi:hypothetical protein